MVGALGRTGVGVGSAFAAAFGSPLMKGVVLASGGVPEGSSISTAGSRSDIKDLYGAPEPQGKYSSGLGPGSPSENAPGHQRALLLGPLGIDLRAHLGDQSVVGGGPMGHLGQLAGDRILPLARQLSGPVGELHRASRQCGDLGGQVGLARRLEVRRVAI